MVTKQREKVIAYALHGLIKRNDWKQIGLARDTIKGEVVNIRNVYAAR